MSRRSADDGWCTCRLWVRSGGGPRVGPWWLRHRKQSMSLRQSTYGPRRADRGLVHSVVPRDGNLQRPPDTELPDQSDRWIDHKTGHENGEEFDA